ncbi:MAG: Uncharacterised protein [Methanobacteriota archaeon]|nr:MAG: Uncharacterised protein [Euryarchaeota archaeon]
MKSQFSALSLCLLIIMMPFSGCILDQQFKGTHVATFVINDLGEGTSNTDDTIIQISLKNTTPEIRFNDGLGSQDGGEHYRFRILIGDLNDANRPAYECRIATQSPDECIILEEDPTMNDIDGVWEYNEFITLKENDVDICSSGCQVQLTIMNGDIVTEAEENLQFIARNSVGGPISHTTNFWMGQ